MKKFSIKNYWKPTPEIIQKISEFIQVLLGLVATSSLVAGSPTLSACLLIAAGATDKFFKLFA